MPAQPSLRVNSSTPGPSVQHCPVCWCNVAAAASAWDSPTAVKQFAQVEVSSLLCSSWMPTCGSIACRGECVLRDGQPGIGSSGQQTHQRALLEDDITLDDG